MLLLSCSTNKVASMSSGPGIRGVICQALRVSMLLLVLASVIRATPQFLSEDDQVDDDPILTPDKRPARLSYFRAPYGSGGGGSYGRRRYNSYAPNGYSSHSYGGGYGKYDWWRKKAVYRNNMPWENLPNTNCLRQFCRSDNDCCRRYSKCNEEAHVCYDCWYGHPCSSHTDCCERFPYCNPVLRTCGK